MLFGCNGMVLHVDYYTPVNILKHDLSFVITGSSASPKMFTLWKIVLLISFQSEAQTSLLCKLYLALVTSCYLKKKKNREKPSVLPLSFAILSIAIVFNMNNLCNFEQWHDSENHCIWAAKSKPKWKTVSNELQWNVFSSDFIPASLPMPLRLCHFPLETLQDSGPVYWLVTLFSGRYQLFTYVFIQQAISDALCLRLCCLSKPAWFPFHTMPSTNSTILPFVTVILPPLWCLKSLMDIMRCMWFYWRY